jgi:uncharacterized Rossmann fold enzyme
VRLIEHVSDAIRREGFYTAFFKIFRRMNTALKYLQLDLIKQFRRWKSIKGRYQGKRVFIIGNGPSLNETELYLLKDEYTMCFNRFFLFEERLNWTPNFFMATDGLVLEDLEKEFSEIIPKTDISIFPGIHFHGKNYSGSLDEFSNTFWTIPLIGRRFSKLLPFIYPGHSVIYDSFQVLKHLGFAEIILLGVDFNYKIHETAKVISTNNIGIESQADDDPNHFDPRYFGKNRRYHQPKDFIIQNMVNDMEYLAKKVTNESFNIINAGVKSKLTFFSKKPLNDLINYSEEEKEEIFCELFNKVIKQQGQNSIKISDVIFIEEYSGTNNCEKIFSMPLKNGLKMISILIFKYIPLGPFKNKYYFIRRKREISNA